MYIWIVHVLTRCVQWSFSPLYTGPFNLRGCKFTAKFSNYYRFLWTTDISTLANTFPEVFVQLFHNVLQFLYLFTLLYHHLNIVSLKCTNIEQVSYKLYTQLTRYYTWNTCLENEILREICPYIYIYIFLFMCI